VHEENREVQEEEPLYI